MDLVIIADDLTGAADTGIQFAKQGFYTLLLPYDIGESAEAQVIALSTNSRGLQPEQAYSVVRDATKRLVKSTHPQNFYKKIDSTLRGNVGAEIEAVMDATGSELAIVAPAFPRYNRTTEDGVHYVSGLRLSRTEAAFDPISPVTESYIPVLLQKQTKLKIGHVALAEVRSEIGLLAECIRQHKQEGEKIIVFDAVTDDDLKRIAEAGMSISPTPLMVGSAGLADQISRARCKLARPPVLRSRIARRPARYKLARPPALRSVIIIISGSLSAVTSKQLDEVRKAGSGHIIPVQPHELVESESEKQVVSKVLSAAENNTTVGVQSVIDKVSYCTAPEEIAECLGRIALQVVRRCVRSIRALILTGGDTALAVFRHLGISGVHLVDEILPGIPYSRVVDGEFDGLVIVTKAGAFGDKEALTDCIDFLMDLH